MKLQPVGDRVVIKEIKSKKEEKSPSGIILSAIKDFEKPELGEVVAVSTSEKMKEIKLGDKILYSHYQKEIKEDNYSLKIVNLEDILAVVIE